MPRFQDASAIVHADIDRGALSKYPAARTTKMTASKPTIVLVPGAWHFPDCFDTFIPYLTEKGYETSTVTLRSVLRDNQAAATDHYEDAAIIRNHVEGLISQQKDVVVFAHSYAGVPTTEALSGLGKDGTSHGVTRIMYCSATVPKEGQSHVTLVTHPEVESGCPKDFAYPNEDGSIMYLIKDAAIRTLYPDVDPKVVEDVYSRLGNQSLRVWFSPMKKCAFRDVPCSYIVCTQDRAFQAFVQRWIAKNAGIEDVVEIESSHSPFLSRPRELAEIMDGIIRRS